MFYLGLNGRNVTCDNFFTSHHLAVELKKRQMTLVGTIRKNRKEIPPILLDMKRKPSYHTSFVFEPNLRAFMLSYVPKKRRFVSLLSTYHSSVHIDEHDEEKKPDIIRFYNETKGGVDVLDKLVGTYRSKRKVNRWTVALFCNMLDVSACNAFIVYIAMNPDWNASKKNSRRRLFLIEVGESLCYSYMDKRKNTPRSKDAAALLRSVQGFPEDENQPGPSGMSITHAPKTQKRATCAYCKRSENRNVHNKRCDKCLNFVCPKHLYCLCEKCIENA